MAASNEKRIHRLTRHDIIELMNKNDIELLMKVSRTSFGFDKFLKNKEYFKSQEEIDYELFEFLIEVSSRVCTIRRQNCLGSVQKFLSTLANDCKEFLFNDAFTVINECLNRKGKICFASYLKHYLIILKTMMKNDIATETIANYTYPSLQNVANELKSMRIQNLQEVQDEYQKLKKEVDKYDRPSPGSDEDDDEAGLFRQLSIVPKDNDIVNVILSDLPCNKIDGPYSSVNQYLSVHFRLMREDMIRSFRDCIKMCENPSEAVKSGCRIYESVKVQFPPKYDTSGICYTIQVQTNKVMDLTTVLMPGSMVCLTPDSFQTVYFAILTSNPKGSGKTKQCTSEIRLDELFDNVLKKDVEYLMFEPNAYFECYRHVLSAIKGFNKNNLPLADFLVFLDFDKPEPEYLACPEIIENQKYCLHEKCDESNLKSCSENCRILNEKLSDNKSELCIESKLKNNKCDRSVRIDSFKEDLDDESKSDISDDCKVFNPLCCDEWPTAADLKLDDQQLEAFKVALTNKVAVIQGPPGTGKTFMGVKIVKTLLCNVPLTPIIICCLTNHALDQFLERILVFEKKIIRLGLQSESGLLEPHNLENLCLAAKQSCDENTHLTMIGLLKKSLNLLQELAPQLPEKRSGNYDEHFVKCKKLCKNLNDLFSDLMLCKDKYLDDSTLNKIIREENKKQLREGSSNNSKVLSFNVLEWLCCSRTSELYEKCEDRFNKLKKKKFDPFLYNQDVNVWSLKLNERYEFFFNWRKNYLCHLEEEIKVHQDDLVHLQQQPYKGREPDPLKIDILKSAFVIGVTTTGAAKYRDLLRCTNATIMIVEEAAQVLESHIIASLLPTTQHLILIGDHKQLRPLPSNHELSEVYNLKISMFERLFNNGCPSATLVSQHRMKPCIADLLVQDHLYDELKSYKNVYEYEEILGVKSSVYFLDHSSPESESSSSTSLSNKHEAQMIVSLTKYLCKQDYTEDLITILAAYSAQILLIEEYLKEENMNVKVTTVDNYQGEENDIVLISFVRGNKYGRIGFLSENNRVNVALSRARKGMFCFGNFSLYAEKSELWKCIVDKLKPEKIGPELPLQCKQHSTTTFVNDSDQILQLIQRGCSEKCGFKLPCGHLCVRKCHYDDADHSRYDCPLPCEKVIADGRKCNRLCFERCKSVKKLNVTLKCTHRARQRKDGSVISICVVEEQKLLPCGHVDTVLCSSDISTHKCRKSVSVPLSCGHKKDVHCYKKNDLTDAICDELKPTLGPCGHNIDIPCRSNSEEHELLSFCKNTCGILLNCGHPCSGKCSICSDSGIHAFCTVKCSVMLSCGHECHGYCGSPCPPCNAKCLLSCSHGMSCCNLCIRPCVLCQEKCDRGCSHVGRCNKKCFEMCSVEACSKVCRNILPCGHKCAGLCGDPCPYLCRVCNEEDFESGNPKSDFYIELEDCNHVVEIGKMDELFNDCIDCLMWPCCPSCNLPIRNSTRYKSLIKRIKKSILTMYDNSDEIDEVQYLLNSLYPDSVIPFEFLDVHKRIMSILNTTVKPSSATLLVLKRCIMSIRTLILVNQKFREIEILKKKMFLQNRFNALLKWIRNHLKCASYQQLDELDAQTLELKKQTNQEL
ncbi:NFX1-type zinc finger-containing protein 1 [Nephila pilipes]|uniref:NFX1-type zinc finger-containing protein 1 n=1 Tax=Nephila pilipes TaxID=299642 RepID=A0A8X6TDB1_NEPPI|nr:NFX1-type zinc finger-containing protein 1 [Nephila pilipes]